jgi:hypothetical protein
MTLHTGFTVRVHDDVETVGHPWVLVGGSALRVIRRPWTTLGCPRPPHAPVHPVPQRALVHAEVTRNLRDRLVGLFDEPDGPFTDSRSYFFRFSGISIRVYASTVRGEPQTFDFVASSCRSSNVLAWADPLNVPSDR